MQGLRVALTLGSPGVPAATVAALEGVFQALGFESWERREALAQDFLRELALFRKQLDALRSPVRCALVALVAPRGQLRQPRQLVQELSCCEALQGCPKVVLLLSSGAGAALEPGAFLAGLRELCGCRPHWSLLQLLTELFCRVAEESAGDIRCPVFQSSLRGALCLASEEPWRPEVLGTGRDPITWPWDRGREPPAEEGGAGVPEAAVSARHLCRQSPAPGLSMTCRGPELPSCWL